ncbi:MAG TPA: hypothetical protein VMG39_05740 [Pseudolabrys sp.]|nr:hypothetical protein [Pseudolabrys sp.]
MKLIGMIGLVVATGFAVAAADPALARVRHHHKVVRHCVNPPREVGLYGFLFNPAPEPNGCAPPVYAYGRYQGQDPDPYIRLQLERDPKTGYRPY